MRVGYGTQGQSQILMHRDEARKASTAVMHSLKRWLCNVEPIGCSAPQSAFPRTVHMIHALTFNQCAAVRMLGSHGADFGM
jgi:hypothetical protein